MQEPKIMTLDFGNGLETYVLTPIDEYDEQKQRVDDDEIKLRPWAQEITGIKSYNTLIPILIKYRDVLDVNNGGCVYFPDGPRKPYKFIAKEFKEFVLRHKREFAKAKV